MSAAVSTAAPLVVPWSPLPIPIPTSQPVLLGNLTLPIGPINIRIELTPNVVEQVTRNSIYLWAYGYLPQTYILEGYPNAGDINQMTAIISQFTNNELTVLPLIIPYMNVQDYVRLTKWIPSMSQATGYGEPYYHIELASAGPDIVAGITTL